MKQLILKFFDIYWNKLKNSCLRMSDMLVLRQSRSLNIDKVTTVCLTLGPYRNLTTLTAATLFLHPNCQVLNHAGRRIFGNKKVDFLSNYDKNRLDRFIQYAILISSKGKRGYTGGSIIFSHAFDSKHAMKNIYDNTKSGSVKTNIKSLFWKESLLTSNLIRKNNIDLGYIFDKEDRLRFILPIRNPMDCAVSNINTGLVNIFSQLNKKSTIIETVQAVLDEIFWFAELKSKFPNRFFYYFEHEISKEMLTDLSKFLQLVPTEEWLTNALSVMKIKSGYKHKVDIINFYREYIIKKEVKFPDLSKKLLLFTS